MADRNGRIGSTEAQKSRGVPFKYDIRVTGDLFGDKRDNGSTTKVSVKVNINFHFSSSDMRGRSPTQQSLAYSAAKTPHCKQLPSAQFFCVNAMFAALQAFLFVYCPRHLPWSFSSFPMHWSSVSVAICHVPLCVFVADTPWKGGWLILFIFYLLSCQIRMVEGIGHVLFPICGRYSLRPLRLSIWPGS
ncbi:hypothetical protein BX661DRAFT_33602 [Kickxella alabastrina]|uniref:uncharacterized protein n=1 Tax=Kickxella alabastrina TaxID=61397 RepID=UPI0022209D49|nr:uncharacterized protein BX661DRAFT_33602 [Kickxella alabastrina]KAI7826426.1 hypothetical protein BX661DRAFT_33602 [Kickxella alabastrina]